MSDKAVSFSNRTSLLKQLKQQPEYQWDIIVVGGGIIGAGILREASRKGLTALLVEQQDFAWGTSSRSSKMVHGGLRYIAQGDIKLTKHSVQERERLLREAPGLINRMGYYFLIHKGQFPGRFVMSTLLSIYDWLAGIKDNRFFNKDKLTQIFKGIEEKKLKGACYYTDTVVDDARLVLRVLQDSIAAGGQVLNYAKVVKLTKDEDNQQVTGVVIEANDGGINGENTEENKAENNGQLILKSSVVINATGAWADKLRSEVIKEKRIRPLRGSHLLFSQQKFPINGALTLFHPKDKRPVFISTWEGVTLVGTTDLDHDECLDSEASITQQEVDYLLEVITMYFPQIKLTGADVLSSFSGVRPVITSDKSFDSNSVNAKKAPSKERRDHAVWANKGLITATGGKLTTFRLTAVDALNAAMPWLKDKIKPAQQNGSDRVFETPNIGELVNINKSLIHANSKWLQRMLGRYGVNAYHLLQDASKNPDEMKTIESSQFCLAELRWAVKHEAVSRLDDLLLRRTRLGLLLKNGAQQLFPALSIICQQELGWNEQKWQDEVSRYQAIWQKHYSLPLQ